MVRRENSCQWSFKRREEKKHTRNAFWVATTQFSHFYHGKYIFQIIVVDPISLLHSITPSLLHSITRGSLPVRHLETRGTSQMKLEGNECSSENLNLTPTEDLCGRCLSFIITYQGSSSWLLTRFKAPCVETIMYPKLSR